MKNETRQKIKRYIDAATCFDVDTIRFHRDGTVSAVKDANKTFNGPETDRLLIGGVNDLA